ncbi:aspartic and glutamic acid-rich protein-like, partial [Penaeus indicus]|uniref:aspartic and glutamic acid-rich protein-like n=1 Tax=Penaeus indicus TaxID=29960 RepID=UPI00300D363B
MKRRQRSKRKKMEGQKEVGPRAGQDANEGDEGGGEGEKDEDKESIAGEKVSSAEVHGNSEKVLEQEVRDNLRGCLIIDEDSAQEKEEMNSENCTIKVEDTEEVLDEVLDEPEENPDESQNGSLEWQNQNREESYEAQENGGENAVSKIVDKSDTGELEGNGEEDDIRKGIKEEVCSDESPVGSPMSPMETSPSTSAVPQENVVAQLNQLQQTVVSHILQYQAGVMAQFQQLQQQMLSQLTSGTSQTTSAVGVKNNRKRPASSMSSADTREDKLTLADIHCKRKRTAFDQRQYQVLEVNINNVKAMICHI